MAFGKAIRSAAGERTRKHARAFSRARIITKTRVLRQRGKGWARANPRHAAAHVLWDPEVDSFT